MYMVQDNNYEVGFLVEDPADIESVVEKYGLNHYTVIELDDQIDVDLIASLEDPTTWEYPQPEYKKE